MKRSSKGTRTNEDSIFNFPNSSQWEVEKNRHEVQRKFRSLLMHLYLSFSKIARKNKVNEEYSEIIGDSMEQYEKKISNIREEISDFFISSFDSKKIKESNLAQLQNIRKTIN